jgi:hypothetical protein
MKLKRFFATLALMGCIGWTLIVVGCTQVKTDARAPSIVLPENEHFIKFEQGVLTTRRTTPQIPPVFNVYQVEGTTLKFQTQFVGNR